MTWDLMRSSGLILLALFSLSVALGALTARAQAGGLLPAFVPRTLHRDLALLSMVLLTLHIATAVLDTYVEIHWWQAFVPGVPGTYQPLWLGLGAVATDIVVAVALTTAIRLRLGVRAWRLVHLLTYPAWLAALSHGIGMGTDIHDGSTLALWVTAGSVAVVAAAVAYRLVRLGTGRLAGQLP